MNKKAITTSTIKAMKQQGEPITMVTAYDVAMARNVNEAGVEMILVGDSVGNVMLGYGSTVPVTMEEMLHHTKAVMLSLIHISEPTRLGMISYAVFCLKKKKIKEKKKKKE